MSLVQTFSEVEGLRGLIALADSDPAVLEQIRRHQKELSKRRNVGDDIFEYRQILEARLQRLKDNHFLFSDSSTTILRIAQEYLVHEGEKSLPTAVLGMITYDLNVGPAYTDAEVWDLFVPEQLRKNSDISLRLIQYCHEKFIRAGVTTSRAKLPHKRSYLHWRPYIAAGYTHKRGGLEYRFATEG